MGLAPIASLHPPSESRGSLIRDPHVSVGGVAEMRSGGVPQCGGVLGSLASASSSSQMIPGGVGIPGAETSKGKKARKSSGQKRPGSSPSDVT